MTNIAYYAARIDDFLIAEVGSILGFDLLFLSALPK
jgi:hypothetical protein